MTDKWLYISYAAYWVAWIAATMGWAGYAVFIAGHSGWWILAGAVLSGCGYRPHVWRGLVDGVHRPNTMDIET